MSKRFVVGLTGGIGSGKSTIAQLFADLDVDLVDADLLAREVVEPGSIALPRIAEHFGDSVVAADGTLQRADLRKLIFDNGEEKRWLENLLHPLIRELMLLRISQSSSAYCMLVSPLLLETDQCNLVDRILVIDVSEATQLSRTLSRDNSEVATIKSIMNAQISRQQRLHRADDILDNEADASTLPRQVAALHEHYIQLSR